MATERSRRWLRGITTWVLAGTMMAPASAQAENATDSAKAHYARGYELANAGEFEAAIGELEQAYALSPHDVVLFNLGQAYGAAGRAVEAARTLEKYLELGGASGSAEERRRVGELIQLYRRRSAKLTLDIRPSGATVLLDGRALGTAPLSAAVEVDAGEHGLVVTADGFITHVESLRVVPGEGAQRAIRLEQRSDAASLELSCALPDVQVSIDGAPRGKTPLPAPLLLRAGPHQLVLSRTGYRSSSTEVSLEPGRLSRLSCQLDRDPRAPHSARLSIEHPQSTTVSVDGALFHGEPLPSGAHRVVVAGNGFDGLETPVELEAGASLRLRIVPPTSRRALEQGRERRVKNQRLAAYVVGGVALASGTAAAVLAVSNSSRYAEFRAKNRDFAASHAELTPAETAKALDALLVEENAIRNRDALALALGVASGALLGTSLALWLTATDSRPTLMITGSRAELGYRARF